MNDIHEPNYSRANNVKYYIDGMSARKWCYENKASYSSYWRMKQEGYSDHEIKEYLQKRYIDRVKTNSTEEIAAYIRGIYLLHMKQNLPLRNLKNWFYSMNLSDDQKNRCWDMATTGKVTASPNIEKWKKIETTKNCFVSNYGNFKKKVKDRVLNYIYPKPYPKRRYNRKKENNRITMHIKLEGKEYSVSKLVATYFVPNPHKYNYSYVIDGNPENLIAENIEWISKSESGRRTGYLSKSKPVKVRKKYSKQSHNYRSVRNAAKELNVSYQTLLDYIKKSTRPKNSVLKDYVIQYL